MIRERFRRIADWLGHASPWLPGVMGAGILLALTGGPAAGFAWTNTEPICIECHIGIAQSEPGGRGPPGIDFDVR